MYSRVCLHECVYICVCAHVCIYVCMYACMHVCMYVCMYVCMHACICVTALIFPTICDDTLGALEKMALLRVKSIPNIIRSSKPPPGRHQLQRAGAATDRLTLGNCTLVPTLIGFVYCLAFREHPRLRLAILGLLAGLPPHPSSLRRNYTQ